MKNGVVKVHALLGRIGKMVSVQPGTAEIVLLSLQALKAMLARKYQEPQLPIRAPELYRNRKNRKETPVEFIRRVYKSWLRKGLTRLYLRKIDTGLYSALSNYLTYNKLPKDLDLPTRKETNDRRLKEIGKISLRLPPEAREIRRLYQLSCRRKKARSR